MLTNRLYLFLASGYYYILALLNYDQFLLISWIYEIYLFKTSTSCRIVSLVFSFILLICHLLIVWVCLIKLKENVQTKQSKLFNGIKPQRKHRLYPSTLLIRRTIFVSFLIWLVIVQSRVLIAILSLIQLIYLVYISYLRPYVEAKDNIIEIMNEVYFFLLLFLLIFFNSESDWSSITTSAYMWTISSNSMLSFLIVFSNSKY